MPPKFSVRLVSTPIQGFFSTKSERSSDYFDYNEIRKLWQSGQVVGLFNLQNEELFNACSDFCIEDNKQFSEFFSKQNSINTVQSENERLNKENTRLNAQIKELNNQILPLRKNVCEKENRKLQERVKTLEDCLNKIKTKNQNINAENENLIKQNRSIKERNAELTKINETFLLELKESKRKEKKIEDENLILQQRVKNLEEINGELAEKVGLLSAKIETKESAVDELHEIISDLKESLREERNSLKEMMEETKELRHSVGVHSPLQQQNPTPLFSLTSPTTFQITPETKLFSSVFNQQIQTNPNPLLQQHLPSFLSPFQHQPFITFTSPSYFTETFGLNEQERLRWIKQLLSETTITEEQFSELLFMSLRPNQNVY